MRHTLPDKVCSARLREGPLASDDSYGANGAFVFFYPYTGVRLLVIASDGLGWDHVSVHVAEKRRCPTWEEMCFVKDLFFDEEECVIEYHPRRSQYVNNHPTTLHLWRPQAAAVPEPPTHLVGIR